MRKRMQHKRYRQTEEAIVEVLLKEKKIPSTEELARKARISRVTLYRHHRAIHGIMLDYEKEILKIYRTIVQKSFKQKTVSLKNVYLQTLIFIKKNWRVFEILFKYNGDRVVERMVMLIGSKVKKEYFLPKRSERLIKIYAKEMAGVIEEWGAQGFLEEELDKVLNDMMWLTNSIKTRLKLFCN